MTSGIEGAVFEDTLPRARKQRQMAKPRSALRRHPQQHPESRPSPRKPFLFEASAAMTKDRQTQQQKAETRKEVSKAKALWRLGKVSKPEYIQFCNRICLLELQASKGDMDKEEVMRIKQTLLASLAGSRRKSAAHQRPKRRTKARTRRCQGATRRPSPRLRPSRLLRPARGRQYDKRITPGGVRMYKHHNKWQKTRRKWWQQLLNNKRDPASVTEGEVELNPTTQRLIPTPRNKKGKGIRRVVNLGTLLISKSKDNTFISPRTLGVLTRGNRTAKSKDCIRALEGVPTSQSGSSSANAA